MKLSLPLILSVAPKNSMSGEFALVLSATIVLESVTVGEPLELVRAIAAPPRPAELKAIVLLLTITVPANPVKQMPPPWVFGARLPEIVELVTSSVPMPNEKSMAPPPLIVANDSVAVLAEKVLSSMVRLFEALAETAPPILLELPVSAERRMTTGESDQTAPP